MVVAFRELGDWGMGVGIFTMGLLVPFGFCLA